MRMLNLRLPVKQLSEYSQKRFQPALLGRVGNHTGAMASLGLFTFVSHQVRGIGLITLYLTGTGKLKPLLRT